YDAGRGRLKLATGDATRMNWTTEIVDNAPLAGQWTSLRFTSAGNPVISYYDGTNKTLKLATKTTTWSLQTVDSAADVGQHSSLASDGAGDPSSDYRAATYSGSALLYDHRLGPFESSAWTTQTWDSGKPMTGEWASLSFDGSGNPALSEYDGPLFQRE